MMKYMEKFVYPDIPENILRGGEIVLTTFYLVVYGYWAKKTGWWERFKGKFTSIQKRSAKIPLDPPL
jgi:hypothetical protein